MNKSQQKKFVRERANDLRTVSRLLSDFGIIRDASGLESAANHCKNSASRYDEIWKYYIADLGFINLDPDKKFRKSRPKSYNSNRTTILKLNLELEGIYDNTFELDPLIKLECTFSVFGKDLNGRTLSNSWHLDRHIRENDEESYFIHPLYHFQYGGNELIQNEEYEYGNMLLLETPRIAVPPMDGIIAIDYILGNYYGEYWRKIRMENQYIRVLKNSIEIFWKPYYNVINSYFNNEDINHNFRATGILPNLHK